MADTADTFSRWFRETSLYLDAFRGQTFVVAVPGEALETGVADELLHNLALLNRVGIRLVLTFGARPQIEAALDSQGIETQLVGATRQVTSEAFAIARDTVNRQQQRLEATLATGVGNLPRIQRSDSRGALPRIVTGNFVAARPAGVVDGVDMQLAGQVRRVDTDHVRHSLDAGAIVMVGPLGHSPSGETFLLSTEHLAVEVADALRADKLIVLTEAAGVPDGAGGVVSELTPSQLQERIDSVEVADQRWLRAAVDACRRRVPRCHIVSYGNPGAILEELFSVDGCGTQVTAESYEQLRQADISDIAGILSLIEPLEAEGLLVRRSRDLLEREIGNFSVIDRDGVVIGCVAVYPFADADEPSGEIACVAMAPAYRNAGRGDALLRAAERQARSTGLEQVFVLTTQGTHWFTERGFELAGRDVLPDGKAYNDQRLSKILVKRLE